MSIDNSDSVFAFGTSSALIEGAFLLRVPTGIQSKEDLFRSYGQVGGIGYFGDNWDAFLDYLRDFTWIPQRNICILHEDVPLSDDPEAARIYLEVLQDAVHDWQKIRESRTGPFIETEDNVPYVEHELFIVFPVSAKDAMDTALHRSGGD